MHPLFGPIEGLKTFNSVPLAPYTRFGIGGLASVLADASTEMALAAAFGALKESGQRYTVIGGGSNLVVSDEGFDGAVLRFTEDRIEVEGASVRVSAGTVLQQLVDRTIDAGLRGLEAMTGIPGWVGGAIYGNAGAYGHSIHERVESVRFFDGTGVHEAGNAACNFRYRESVFKQRKDWIILSVLLRLEPADAAELAATAAGILKIRNEKYPPEMRCAGSIFKNLLYADLPPAVLPRVPSQVIREGKVPSAFFLEQVGAKGMSSGPVRVASYHANLIYNEGGGTARQVRELAEELKRRVFDQFGVHLEEEVQYIF